MMRYAFCESHCQIIKDFPSYLIPFALRQFYLPYQSFFHARRAFAFSVIISFYWIVAKAVGPTHHFHIVVVPAIAIAILLECPCLFYVRQNGKSLLRILTCELAMLSY